MAILITDQREFNNYLSSSTTTMSHIILHKWERLKAAVSSIPREELIRNNIINILLEWVNEIKLIKDKRIKELYKNNFQYFENINLLDYQFEKTWYSIDEIIEYDFLNSRVITYTRAIAKVRDILWNLIVFKSDKDCPLFGHDDLRAFTDIDLKDLYLSCDICGYTESIFGIRVAGESKVVPAPARLVEKFNLNPSIP